MILALVCTSVACGDEPWPPDVDEIVRDMCTVYQACEANTSYATVEECEAKFKMLLEEADGACYEARLRLSECLGALTCVEYDALRGIDSDAKCTDEETDDYLACES